MLLGGTNREDVKGLVPSGRASSKAPDDWAQPVSTEEVAESAASGREEHNEQLAAAALAAASSIRSAADAGAGGAAVSTAAAEQGAEPSAKLLPKRGVKQVLSHGLSRQVAACHAAVTERYLAKEMWVSKSRRGGRGACTAPLKAIIDLPEVRAQQHDPSLSDEERMHWEAFATHSIPQLTKSVAEYLEGHMGLEPDEAVDVGQVLREGLPADPPLRPYLEEFVIPEGDPRQQLVGRLGLRVKPTHASPIPACTFLGFYGGTLRTLNEFEALQNHRITDEHGRHRRKLLLETYASDIRAGEAASRFQWQKAVTSSEVEVDFDPNDLGSWHFIVSGAEGGNGTSLLNDPDIDPRNCKPQDYDQPWHVVGGGANCRLFQVVVGPWVYLGVATIREVAPGSELLYSYSTGQWKNLVTGEADAEAEEELFGPASILSQHGTPEFARWEEVAGPTLATATRRRRTRAYTPQDKEWLRSQAAARRAAAAGAAAAAGGTPQAAGPSSAAGGGRSGSGGWGTGVVWALQLGGAGSGQVAAAGAAVPKGPMGRSMQPAAAAMATAAAQAGQQMAAAPSSRPPGADVASGAGTGRGQKRKSRSPEHGLAAAASPAGGGGTAAGTAAGTAPAIPTGTGPAAPAAATPPPPSRPAVTPLGSRLASGRHSARSSRHASHRQARDALQAEAACAGVVPATGAAAPQQQERQQQWPAAAGAGAGATPGGATAAAAAAGSPGGRRLHSPLSSPGRRQQTLLEAFRAAEATAAANVCAGRGATGAGTGAGVKEEQCAAQQQHWQQQQQQGAGAATRAKRPRQAAPAQQPASGAGAGGPAAGMAADAGGMRAAPDAAATAAGRTAVLSPAGRFQWDDEADIVDLVDEEPPLAVQQQQQQQQQPPQRRPLPPAPAGDEVIDLTLDDD